MFITLKASAAGRNDSFMEQVASKCASNGKSASQPLSRLSRRPACISCQKRKLRCTGSKHDCDRCRTRAIPCVPSGTRQSQRGKTSHSPDDGEGGALDSSKSDALEFSPTRDGSSEEAAQNKMNALFKDGVIDFNLSDNVPDNFSVTFQDFNEDEFYLGNDHSIDAMGQLEPHTLGRPLLTVLPADDTSFPSTAVNMLPSKDSLPQRLTPGPIRDQQLSELEASDTNIPDGSAPSASSPSTCSCIPDTLRVVQQLDDDAFKLSSLAFDQVVQLQKWIMLQCCKPLDCPGCRSNSTALTVVLIICDRLTEMFECIHKRLLKAAQRVHEHSYGSGHSSSATTPETISSTGNTTEQLFCSTCGLAASQANCNPDLFSAEFQNLYSDEEQVHMIQALTRLQIRNFRGLLSRVDGASQGAGSVARRLKIEALTARLTRAAANIEAVW